MKNNKICASHKQETSPVIEKGKCGENAEYSLHKNGSIYIYGSGATYDYDEKHGHHDERLSRFKEKIKYAVVEYGITEIGEEFFEDCNSLIKVELPDTLTSIGYCAFAECEELRTIKLPDSLKSICRLCFGACKALKSINLPDNVVLENGVFYDCESLVHITVSDANVNLVVEDDVLLNKERTELIWCSHLKKGRYIIPDGVTHISDFAFDSCDKLTEILIPDSVKNIGMGAFNYCADLKSLTLPDSVTSIGYFAFSQCVVMESVTLPKNLTCIEKETFRRCLSLKSITIPDSVVSIYDEAFKFCEELTDVTLSRNLQDVASDTFEACDKISTVRGYRNSYGKIFPERVIGKYKRGVDKPHNMETSPIIKSGECGNYLEYTLHENGTVYIFGFGEMFDYNMWNNVSPFTQENDKIKRVIIEEGVETIGVWAFAVCSELMSVTIPKSVYDIRSGAFDECDSFLNGEGIIIGFEGPYTEKYSYYNKINFIKN